VTGVDTLAELMGDYEQVKGGGEEGEGSAEMRDAERLHCPFWCTVDREKGQALPSIV